MAAFGFSVEECLLTFVIFVAKSLTGRDWVDFAKWNHKTKVLLSRRQFDGDIAVGDDRGLGDGEAFGS